MLLEAIKKQSEMLTGLARPSPRQGPALDRTLHDIAASTTPCTDPVYGSHGPLKGLWR